MGKTSSFFPRGLTLIGLVIIVVIIGLLAGGIIIFLDPSAQLQKSRDAQRKSDLSEIQKALEVYYQDNNSYPIGDASSNFEIKDRNGNTVSWNSPWLPYTGTLPRDPSPLQNYVYYSSGQSYYLYASLERGGNDPQACNSGAACQSVSANGLTATQCGGICNYGASTPDVSI
jgi:type II secretory pathway pseudopilin PulG